MTTSIPERTQGPLVALISATPAAIGPASSGLSRLFPEAVAWNILDDRLLHEANEKGVLTEKLAQRMTRLIDHAMLEGADGVLLTCSMYGPTAHTYNTTDVPILAPDDAAFEAAVRGDFGRILVVASFEAALCDTRARFGAALAAAGKRSELAGLVVPDALKPANEDALIAGVMHACAPFRDRVDAVLLAQYSLAPAALALAEALKIPVISGPDTAAAELHDRISKIGKRS
jgi:hypothetical protein